ncbi:hypothetical protein QFZ79_003375 [Arthrobacter sp. V4I6]|uniref:hypothetical protein n=1 Tax=unclassified Arthrobacter TaxID=235627 RepID=UPI0027856E7C|nr:MULTISPECIES: hypothetical protein [unclassified Arthrobacter]MDQ0821003.1 hypothetical protein [Arthrobacter sp. V1I7]MDQ0855264.1 hypothetical protein [Arthrobacter sp. V4I6]
MALKSAETTRHGSGPVRRLGAIGFWGGIAGALSAFVLIVYPPAVVPEQFSYPFNGAGFTVAQVFFAVQNATQVAVIVALLRTPAVGSSRLVRAGLFTGIAGLALLSLLELVVIAAAHSVSGEPLYDLFQALFGIPTMITGIGLVLGGIGVLRVGAWKGAKRFLPLVLGVYVFVPLTPAVMGPHIAGRIGIGIWVLLFALLGWILWRGDGAGSRDVVGSEVAGSSGPRQR